MKTAMQEVLYLVEQMFTNAKTQEVESAMNDVINIITQEGFEKEKEQIAKAFSAGYMIGEELDMIKPSMETAEKYYNQTYNQNK